MAAWNILQKVFGFAYWFDQFGSCFAFDSNTVGNVSCVRDLGMLTDSNLSSAEHIVIYSLKPMLVRALLSPRKLSRGIMESPAYVCLFVCLFVCYHDN